MNEEMDRIKPLDSLARKEFIGSSYRLTEAQNELVQTFHQRPFRSDISFDYEAVAAWSAVTCAYSGIEQAMKCLLSMRGAFIDKGLCYACFRRVQGKGNEKCRNPKKCGFKRHFEELFRAQVDFVHSLDDNRNHRHHNIGMLFRALTPEEQDVLRVSYAIYRSLHDYIPSETVDCFLNAIDKGYPLWRYFLFEGDMPPTTHPGAMIEIWAALVDVLKARVFTNHGLESVVTRIRANINRRIGKEPYFLLDLNKCINFCLEVSEGRLKTDGLSNHYEIKLAAIMEDVTSFVRDGVRTEWIDNDLVYFIQRANRGEIHWNADKKIFERVSRLASLKINLILTEHTHFEFFPFGPSVEVEHLDSVPASIEDFTFKPRFDDENEDADWTDDIDVERIRNEFEEKMAGIEEYVGGDECEAYTCHVGGKRLIIVLHDSRDWLVYEYFNKSIPGVPPYCEHLGGNYGSLREAIVAIENWREAVGERSLAIRKNLWRSRGKRSQEGGIP